MKLFKKATLASAVVLCAFGSATSYAGNCENVTHRFHNDGETRITVKKTMVAGPEGSRPENFNDIVLRPGASGEALIQDYNTVDSGERPYYIRVFFDRWTPRNGWEPHSQVVSQLGECSDGRTYNLHINTNP